MKGKEKKIAWIQLRTNPPAEVYLDNKDYMNSTQRLKGFEWVVYTVENNYIERLYMADYWKQAKKWCVEKGYDFLDDDPSQELYKSLKLLNT